MSTICLLPHQTWDSLSSRHLSALPTCCRAPHQQNSMFPSVRWWELVSHSSKCEIAWGNFRSVTAPWYQGLEDLNGIKHSSGHTISLRHALAVWGFMGDFHLFPVKKKTHYCLLGSHVMIRRGSLLKASVMTWAKATRSWMIKQDFDFLAGALQSRAMKCS